MSKIVLTLDPGTWDNAANELDERARKLKKNADEICKRLADMGYMIANAAYASAYYDSDKNYNITVEKRKNGYAIVASGSDVLFLEFGSGITYGYGHPLGSETGMVPGSYSDSVGKGHWDDPNGWYTPDGQHTFGNPPSMGMYYAMKEIENNILNVAREVLFSD